MQTPRPRNIDKNYKFMFQLFVVAWCIYIYRFITNDSMASITVYPNLITSFINCFNFRIRMREFCRCVCTYFTY